MKMKITVLTCLLSVVLAWSAFGQDPSATPAPSPTATASVAPTPLATATAKDDLESRIEAKVKRGLHIDISPSRHEVRTSRHGDDDDDFGALIAIPIVGIIFGTIFLAPVMIVGVILLFNYMKQRSLHRTVRMMVEKGQEVPAALFAPPPIVRARSDMRRGVVLLMVGLGLMLFFGAVSDWDGGVWALGLIPFLRGAGYLTVWKLEGNKPGMMSSTTTTTTNTGTDNPPPLP
jgi:hypothetical protein